MCSPLTSPLSAQEAVSPRPSPLAIVSCRYKDSYLKIVYSQPHKRGREIFGKLVPYEKVWRTGANEATEITVTRDVFVAGQMLAAGAYTIFTIPFQDHWVIIFNKDLGQWGDYNYNQQTDALRIVAPAGPIDGGVVYEPFTILIDQRNNKGDISFLWDKTKASFPIEFVEPKP